MLPSLTPEEADLVARAKQFARDVVMPNAARWERERQMPLDALRQAAALGLLRIEVPKSAGGLGMSYFAKLRVAEELARACMAFSFSLINVHNAAWRIATDAQPEPRARYVPALMRAERLGGAALSEPGIGSDFAAIRTTARKVDGGWRLDGEKAWITNAAHADVFVTYAQTDPAARGKGIACFLVDGTRPGFDRVAPYQLMGGHAIGAGGFRLTDYFCPDTDLLYPPGSAFKTALGSINGARTYVAAMCCGMLEAALACALRYGAERQVFGARVIDHQGVRWSLAKVANDLEAARLLAYRAAAIIDAKGDALLAAAHAKKFASEMIVARLSDCMQAMGAAGLREEHPIGRHIALARIANYVDGSTEIQNERIGATLLERYVTN
ncbi:MAG: acyl-CoA dehydrogenase family protein [Proteobacteria bacterium]|nr:acyl-CoA dehydrogenase family protein [Pseudomonadota bacterium]